MAFADTAETPTPAQAERGPTILLSAFEPFNGAGVNASQEVARRLHGVTVSANPTNHEASAVIETLLVPVTAGAAERIILERLQQGGRPLLYFALGEIGKRRSVHLGEAEARRAVRLEKVYINWDNFRIPDNGGNQPRDAAIVPDAPAAYFATLPFAQTQRRLMGRTPVPIDLSLSAGSFLCNHLSYHVAHFYTQNPEVTAPFGFVHVPSWRPENGEASLQAIIKTVQAVITDCIALHAADLSD